MFTALSDQIAAVLKRLTARGVLSDGDVTDALREIRRHLLEADVSFEVTQGFVERVRERAIGAIAVQTVSPGQQVVKLVHDEIARMLGASDEDLARKVGVRHAAPLQFAPVGPTVILLVGLQGSGKTTTAAKLARRLKLEQKAPGLVAADLSRPAAREQLEQLGAQVGVPVFGGASDGSGGVGAQHAAPLRSPHGVVGLVRQALREADKARCRTVIVDTAGRLQIDAELMDELKALRAATSPREVLLVAEGMGPLQQVLGPLPGVTPQALKSVNADDRRLKHVEAIVLSMTPGERADPAVLTGSRRLRIAKGAGRTVQEVNRLLEQFRQMRKLLKRT